MNRLFHLENERGEREGEGEGGRKGREMARERGWSERRVGVGGEERELLDI